MGHPAGQVLCGATAEGKKRVRAQTKTKCRIFRGIVGGAGGQRITEPQGHT